MAIPPGVRSVRAGVARRRARPRRRSAAGSAGRRGTNPGLGADWLTLDLARQLFAGADEVKPLEGDPPSAPIYSKGVLQGYVFVTRDVTESLGFSSLEFLIAVGLRLDGTLGGVRVVEHHEPIIDLIMLEDLVPRFARQYAGIDIRAPLRVSLNRVQEQGAVDGISAATISAVLFNEAILRRRAPRRPGEGACACTTSRCSISSITAPPISRAWRRAARSGACVSTGRKRLRQGSATPTCRRPPAWPTSTSTRMSATTGSRARHGRRTC